MSFQTCETAPRLHPSLVRLLPLATGLLLTLSAGCGTTESHRVVETESVASYDAAYTGPLYDLSVGSFANGTSYDRGVFTEGQDRLGNQARTILKTHLSQSRRFTVLDRENLGALAQESSLSGTPSALQAAGLVITGQVTEFGRRTTGDKQLFGILGRGKQQLVASKVSLNIVDVATSKIVHSVQGAGEYQLNDREVFGTGTRSGYDSTLNGKVLNLAVTDAVNKLVSDIDSGRWNPAG